MRTAMVEKIISAVSTAREDLSPPGSRHSIAAKALHWPQRARRGARAVRLRCTAVTERRRRGERPQGGRRAMGRAASARAPGRRRQRVTLTHTAT